MAPPGGPSPVTGSASSPVLRQVCSHLRSRPVVAAQSAAAGTPTPFATGKSTVQVDFGGTALTLWVFKPDSYCGAGFLLLFHGASRAAEAYRDNAAAGFAERTGQLVVVPHFDKERFPNRMYQLGGLMRADGSVADPAERTFAFVPRLVEHVRACEGQPELSYSLLGYSAGAQFIERMAAFLDTDAERLIAMSPGSALFPTREMDYGLGFGGLPDALSDDARLRRYLALPLTVAVGTADTEITENLPQGDGTAGQGVHRYSRNLRWFVSSMDLAFERG